jgi:hypothetical protein
VKRVTYDDATYLMAADAAEAPGEYARVLAHAGSADAVTLRCLSSDGDAVQATFLLHAAPRCSWNRRPELDALTTATPSGSCATASIGCSIRRAVGTNSHDSTAHMAETEDLKCARGNLGN